MPQTQKVAVPHPDDAPGPQCPHCSSLKTVQMDQFEFNPDEHWCFGCDEYFRYDRESLKYLTNDGRMVIDVVLA